MKKRFPNKIFFIVLTVFALMISSFSQGFGSAPVQSEIILTNSTASSKHQELFSPYDTIYALVTLSGLAPGKYTADISWVNSAGTVNQYTPVSLTILPQSPFTFYSWLRLMKNGPFKSNMSGKQFMITTKAQVIIKK